MRYFILANDEQPCHRGNYRRITDLFPCIHLPPPLLSASSSVIIIHVIEINRSNFSNLRSFTFFSSSSNGSWSEFWFLVCVFLQYDISKLTFDENILANGRRRWNISYELTTNKQQERWISVGQMFDWYETDEMTRKKLSKQMFINQGVEAESLMIEQEAMKCSMQMTQVHSMYIMNKNRWKATKLCWKPV